MTDISTVLEVLGVWNIDGAPSNLDANTLRDTGVYSVSNIDVNQSHLPDYYGWFLHIDFNCNTGYRRLQLFISTTGNQSFLFYRGMFNDNWASWVKIAFSSYS